jgi:hypothetical protein
MLTSFIEQAEFTLTFSYKRRVKKTINPENSQQEISTAVKLNLVILQLVKWTVLVLIKLVIERLQSINPQP